MENCGSAVIKCDRIFTWPSDQPRHATYASAYPVETNSPPVEACETSSPFQYTRLRPDSQPLKRRYTDETAAKTRPGRSGRSCRRRNRRRRAPANSHQCGARSAAGAVAGFDGTRRTASARCAPLLPPCAVLGNVNKLGDVKTLPTPL